MEEERSVVIVNNEPVHFEGPPPATVGEVIALVDQALLGQGQLMESCLVDGQPLGDTEAIYQAAYHSIAINACPWEDACRRAVLEAWDNADKTVEEIQAFGSAMLVVPYSQVMSEIGELADKLGKIMPPYQAASQYASNFNPDWKTDLDRLGERIQTACERFTKAIEKHDVGRAAAVLCMEMPACFRSLKNLEGAPWTSGSAQ